MGEAVTRAEYACRAEMTRGAVEMWIVRDKLTARQRSAQWLDRR
jgi:hypothetical protein